MGAQGGLSAEGAREAAIAEGKKLSPSRLGGLGERDKLPSGVWGGDPEADVILDILSQNGVHFRILIISHFLNN